MRKVTLSTETTTDLSKEYFIKRDIFYNCLSFNIGGVEYDGTFENSLDIKGFYQKMRDGAKTSTSQITSETFLDVFNKLLSKGKDVLHLAFSSALSGTYNSAVSAAEQVNKTSKNKVYVVDSKAASMGQGLFVHLVTNKADEGVSAQEVYNYALSIVDKINHYFVVDDLDYLYRGGRVSRASAIIGSVLHIKPVLHVDMQGRLIKLKTVITRRKSLQALVTAMEERYNKMSGSVFMIHGDCIDDANYVAKLIKERLNIDVEIINMLGPVIGAHSGPGTVALFFTADTKAVN